MSGTSPTSRRRAVVLHIGTGKTGTSSVQARLAHNRPRLEELGVLFPASPGRRRHIRLGLAMRPDDRPDQDAPAWRWQDESSPAALREVVARELLHELAGSRAQTLLLSDESLYGAGADTILTLRRFLEDIASSVRVVVYLRRQDDHMCSRYQQLVKRVGETRRLAERVEQVDFAELYDYRARLELWRRTLAPDELVVRLFEPARLAGGSLVQDFLDAAGLDVRAEQLDEVPAQNESLDVESVEVLRLLNLLTEGRPGATAELVGRARGFRALHRASDGPTLTLPAERLDAFMARWEESDRAVAAEWFPDRTEGLWAQPRKTRHTTTEQRLDPARVDHFVQLLGLSDDVGASLRRLAEREAVAG